MSTTLEPPSRAAPPARPLTVALAGNPNAGKTSLFNALTGLRQKVANYPGVTVERKEGAWALAEGAPPSRLVDLPGLYSLDAASPDEQIAHDVLTGRAAHTPAPDVIVVAVDATNIERNLYLVTQLLEIGRPLVVALTMVDLAVRAGVEVDAERRAEPGRVHLDAGAPGEVNHRQGDDERAADFQQLRDEVEVTFEIGGVHGDDNHVGRGRSGDAPGQNVVGDLLVGRGGVEAVESGEVNEARGRRAR